MKLLQENIRWARRRGEGGRVEIVERDDGGMIWRFGLRFRGNNCTQPWLTLVCLTLLLPLFLLIHTSLKLIQGYTC